MGVHGPTAVGSRGKRASSTVRIGLTQSMMMRVQHQLGNAMEQLGCATVAESRRLFPLHLQPSTATHCTCEQCSAYHSQEHPEGVAWAAMS